MQDNTTIEKEYELDAVSLSQDDSAADEPMLDLSQLENTSVSDLAESLIEPFADNTYSEEEGEGSLDLSSLSDNSDDGESDNTAEGIDPEALYNDTLSLMMAGKTDLETAVRLLKRSADGGFIKAWLYLGQIYSNKGFAIYNPALAFECYRTASELGNADGMFNMGLCLNKGFGCAKDDALAVECFCRGAELFDANCICALGMCYEFGTGCEINYEFAFNLYKKGTELGHAASANNLGGCYFYGHGVEQNHDLAIETFQKAAELGSTAANCRLGICYLTGDGCEQNNDLAFENFKSAALQNNPTAIFNLAKCYDNGIGTEQNFRSAYKYYTRAAALGHAEAKYEAGKMSLAGRGTRKDADAAYRLFSSAARHGFAPAEYEVANCFFEGSGAVRNRASAYNHYLAAYESAGEMQADAAYRLGLCRLKGLGISQDKNKAAEWFLRGAELGSPEAAYMLGECYFYGTGVYRDTDKALALYLKAASACSELATLTKCHAHLHIAIAHCYEQGLGAVKDASRAISAYKEAARSGDVEALYRTGRAIISGVGMKPDYPAARTYLLRAARHGYMPAMLMMGIFSEDGRGIQKSAADAKSWYLKAVTVKSDPKMSLYDFPERFADAMTVYAQARTEAQYRLGMMTARTGEASEDRIRAFELIAISAAMGYTPARLEITKIHLSGGDLKTYYESPLSHKNATFDGGSTAPSAKDLAIAMYKLGDAFFDGRGLVKKNESASASCYKFAAELGMVDACYSYGWCLRHGVGIDENDAEAVKWLKLAADRGNAGAAYSYGLCCEEGAGTGVKNKREAMYYYRIAAASGHADAAKRYVLLSDRGE